MHARLVKANTDLAEVMPGYRIEANDTGRFVWSLVGPDGTVHYEREFFGEIVVLSRDPRAHARMQRRTDGS